jgi:hypothetical protein
MDAAGFKTSFRKLEEDVPPAKVVPTSTLPSPPPAVPAPSNPILTPLDANSELMVSRDDSGLGIFDSIIGIIGGTKRDFVDESFNFTYGVGDNMSLGLGWLLRSTFFHDQADYGGSSYYIGSWVGFAGDLLMGVGAFKALGKTFGREALESGLRNAPSNGVTMAAGARVLAQDVAKYAKNVKAIDGYADVFIHGRPSGTTFAVLHDGKWVDMSHRQLATWLGHQGVKGDVRLISCYSGMLDTGSVAQNLANKLGVKVMAPTNAITVHPNGMLTAPLGTIWKILVPGAR